jgi:hypothetical protein
MIKPLVAKTLGIQSSYGASTPNYANSRSRSRPNPSNYMRDDSDQDFELAKYSQGRYHTTTVRGGGVSDGDSETHILPDGSTGTGGSDGVMKTTEITVNTAKRD